MIFIKDIFVLNNVVEEGSLRP